MSNGLQRPDVLAILRRFKDTRGESYGITKIGVFGSVARGEPGADSDIDVVYETTGRTCFGPHACARSLRS